MLWLKTAGSTWIEGSFELATTSDSLPCGIDGEQLKLGVIERMAEKDMSDCAKTW
jgi:hypothetical protein